MRDIVAGIVLIGIGFAVNSSVFLGDFNARSIIFDGLGVFFIVRGVVKIVGAKRQDTTSSSPPPAPPAAR